jgi:ethanolamine utilization protein EutN
VNLGRVTGRVVCTRRVEELGRYGLLLVQPVDEAGADEGHALVAADPLVHAAAGDVIWFVNGVEAVDALDGPEPVDAVIVGMRDR